VQNVQRYVSMTRICLLAMLLTMIVMLVLPTSTYASAIQEDKASGLHISAKAGYNDQYKEGNITPVFIKLTNQGTGTLAGDFVFNIVNTNGLTVSHITPVEVNAGDEISFVIEVEGKLVQNYNSFHFFEGGINKKKELPISGQTYVKADAIVDENLVGIVASDPDTLNFLVFLNQYGYQLKTNVLGEGFDVTSAQGLGMFDVIFLNDVATNGWSQEKISAIKQWVQSGGSLVLSGGAGYSKTAEAFKDITPVTASETILLEQTNEITGYANQEQSSLAPLYISSGKLEKGHSLLEIADQPIIAKYSYGKGFVYYLAFNPALEPFSTWKDASQFIGTMLNDELMIKGVYAKEKLYFNWQLGDAVSFFPQLGSPSLGLLLLIIACYIVIVAPLMYLILKKIDKREYAWWTIPSTAIVTVAIVILIGSADKHEHQVHNVNVVTINNDVQTKQGIVSVFLSSSDKLTMEIPSHQTIAFNESGRRDLDRLIENYEYTVVAGKEKQQLEWNHNNYWSSRTLLLNARSETVDVNKTIETSINEIDGKLVLTVKNTTGEKLEHIGLVNGPVIFNLGNLDNGEELVYDLPSTLQITRGNLGYIDYASQLFNSNQNNKDYRRETVFLQGGGLIDERVGIIAFSYSKQTDYPINQKKYKQDSMTYWTKSLVDMVQAYKTDERYYDAALDKFESDKFEQYKNNEFFLNAGEIEFSYVIPSKERVDQLLIKLSPQISEYSNLTAEIFNVRTERWDSYVDAQFMLADYIDQAGKVKFKLSTQFGANGYIPTLVLEGEIQK